MEGSQTGIGSASQLVSAAAPQPGPGPISVALAHLDAEINELQLAINGLDSTLDPLLEQVPPSPSAPDSNVPGSGGSSEVATQVTAYAISVSYAIDRIRSLARRVEL